MVLGGGQETRQTKQTSIQQQVGTESGVSFGGVYAKSGQAVYGGGSSGNITLGAGVGQSRVGASTLSIVTNDPRTAIAALENQQALSSLAVSTSGQTALHALETLRALQAGNIVAASDNPAAVGQAMSGKPVSDEPVNDNTKLILATVAAVVIGGLILWKTL